jgi:hypothetical protein
MQRRPISCSTDSLTASFFANRNLPVKKTAALVHRRHGSFYPGDAITHLLAAKLFIRAYRWAATGFCENFCNGLVGGSQYNTRQAQEEGEDDFSNCFHFGYLWIKSIPDFAGFVSHKRVKMHDFAGKCPQKRRKGAAFVKGSRYKAAGMRFYCFVTSSPFVRLSFDNGNGPDARDVGETP